MLNAVLESASLSIFKDFIDIAKQLYVYLTPQYKEAGEALIKITDNILTAQNDILKWVRKFERLDLNNSKEFNNFYDEFYDFRDGPGFDSITVNCHQILSVYDKFLANYLKKWLASDQAKLSETQQIFNDLGSADADMKDVSLKIMKGLEDKLKDIKSDYKNANNLRSIFLAEIDNDVKMLRAQSDELRKLRGEFIGRANVVLS
jgi:phosphopantothenate synthetase